MSIISESPKYTKLFETAMVLFKKYGFKRITVEEICRTASVSKMTFYKYFKNKKELAFSILTTLFEQGRADFKEIREMDISYREKVNLIIKMKHEYSKEFSKEFFEEIIDSHSDFHSFVMEYSQSNMADIVEFLKEGQHSGEIRKSLKIEYLVYMLNNLYELIEDPNLQNFFNDVEELTHQLTTTFFYGIMTSRAPDEN